jgi:hypothetical protein
VARAMYEYSWTPSQTRLENASTRSSRRFWCSYHGPHHHVPLWDFGSFRSWGVLQAPEHLHVLLHRSEHRLGRRQTLGLECRQDVLQRGDGDDA